jgi:hypothetical protein
MSSICSPDASFSIIFASSGLREVCVVSSGTTTAPSKESSLGFSGSFTVSRFLEAGKLIRIYSAET